MQKSQLAYFGPKVGYLDHIFNISTSNLLTLPFFIRFRWGF